MGDAPPADLERDLRGRPPGVDAGPAVAPGGVDDPFWDDRLRDLDRVLSQPDRGRRRRSPQPRRPGRPRRSQGATIVALAVVLPVVAMVGGYALLAWVSAPVMDAMDVAPRYEPPTRPSPQPAVSDVPLGAPAPHDPGGEYAFRRTQGPASAPVAFDPCRPVALVVNGRTAPDGAEALLAGALAQVSAASGFRFEVEGATSEPVRLGRESHQYLRYGDRWAPVLVVWTDVDEWAGVGRDGGTARADAIDGPGGSHLVSGLVALDGPRLGRLLGEPGGRAEAEAIVVRQLGRLLGLADLRGADELMDPGSARTELGPGDRTALALLGTSPCAATL